MKSLVIKLQRHGRIKRPFYYIIVTRKQKKEKGAFLAKVGYYDPFSTLKNDFKGIVIYKNLLNFWIGKGAVPNDKVRKLIFVNQAVK